MSDSAATGLVIATRALTLSCCLLQFCNPDPPAIQGVVGRSYRFIGSVTDGCGVIGFIVVVTMTDVCWRDIRVDLWVVWECIAGVMFA